MVRLLPAQEEVLDARRTSVHRLDAELEVRIAEVDRKFVARIDTGPAAGPIFATAPGGNGKPAFLVRINNSTQELDGQEAHEYQKKRWPS
jgi:hypothetical protein